MKRRSFFSILFAPILARFFPVVQARTKTLRVGVPVLRPVATFYKPDSSGVWKITELWFKKPDEAFAFVGPDTPYIKIVEEMTREEFRARYPDHPGLDAGV